MGAETLTETFSRLREKLHRAAMSILRDEMEAQDAVQDAFCNLWNATPPETAAEASNRLFLVLRHVCLNKLRSRRPKIAIEGLEIPLDESDNGDAERLRTLAMKALTPLQQRIFEMIVLRYMDYPETATELGMSVEAVRMNMSRARKKIKEQLTQSNI